MQTKPEYLKEIYRNISFYICMYCFIFKKYLTTFNVKNTELNYALRNAFSARAFFQEKEERELKER